MTQQGGIAQGIGQQHGIAQGFVGQGGPAVAPGLQAGIGVQGVQAQAGVQGLRGAESQTGFPAQAAPQTQIGAPGNVGAAAQAAAQRGVSQVNPGRPADFDADWRFRRHNNEWWYWTPQNAWMYYRQGQWHPYDATTFVRPGTLEPLPRQPFDHRESVELSGPEGPEATRAPFEGRVSGSPGARDTSSGIPDRQYGIGSTHNVDPRYNDPGFRRDATTFGGFAE